MPFIFIPESSPALHPDGNAKIEFPLLNGRNTVEINGVIFKAKELSGTVCGKKMYFSLPAGQYIIK